MWGKEFQNFGPSTYKEKINKLWCQALQSGCQGSWQMLGDATMVIGVRTGCKSFVSLLFVTLNDQ